MSVFIKKSKLRVKNEDGTSYTGVMNAVAEESTEELIKQIEAKGEEVVEKGKKTLESIPEDYAELNGRVDGLKEDLGAIRDILGYKVISHSNNMLIANHACNRPFNEIFTSSEKVSFDMGNNGEYWGGNTNSICAVVVFTDNTVGTLGAWYANDSSDVSIITGGINQAKEKPSNFADIKKIAFYFSTPARQTYADKIIKTIGLFTGKWTEQSNWLDDYYVEFDSRVLKDYGNRISDLEKHDIKMNWYIENTYFIAKGLELNIYYDTICDTNVDVYFVADTIASKDFVDTMDRCLRFRTNSSIGSYPCTIYAYEKGSDILIDKVSFTVNVENDTKPSKKIIFIGDSLTDQNYFVKQVKDNSDGNITLYGTRGNDGYNHEGRSGWYPSTYRYQQSYNGIENAFYNPNKSGSDKFDFAYYMQNNPQFADVEVVNIMLGRNGGYDSDNLVTHLNAIISNIKEYRSDIKIFICLPYFTPWSSDNYYAYRKYSANKMNEASFIGYKAMKDRILNAILIPVGVNIDTIYDYPHSTENVSARNTADKKMYYADNVHPNIYGYQKMADVWYSTMLGN